MSGLRKPALVERICAHLQEQGCEIERADLSGSGDGMLPLNLNVTFQWGRMRRYKIYCWTIGHGGRSSGP